MVKFEKFITVNRDSETDRSRKIMGKIKPAQDTLLKMAHNADDIVALAKAAHIYIAACSEAFGHYDFMAWVKDQDTRVLEQLGSTIDQLLVFLPNSVSFTNEELSKKDAQLWLKENIDNSSAMFYINGANIIVFNNNEDCILFKVRYGF